MIRKSFRRARKIVSPFIVGEPTGKYGNKATIVDGHKFPSKAEAAHYCMLKMDERKGQVSELRLQVPYVFASGVKYIADFVYLDANGLEVVADCKGFRTPEYRIKRKLMKHEFGIEIREVRVNNANLILAAYLNQSAST